MPQSLNSNTTENRILTRIPFLLQVLTCDVLHGSHVSSASGTAWKEGHMDFTGMANKHCLHSYVVHQKGAKQKKKVQRGMLFDSTQVDTCEEK